MMNRFKKVLSLLTAIALLLSGALALAEETIEAPVVDSEPVQVEEIAQETVAAQEELPIIEEEIPAQEEATQEEAPAADETPAQEENTVVEETPVQEEAPAAEPESDPVPSYNNNEETPAEETPAQEEAPVAGEDPFDGDDADDDESYSEDELVTFDDDNWGYVDPEIVSDYIPEMTAELKFPEITKLSVNDKVAGNIDAENDAQYVIKAESNKTIVLDLVASSEKVNVKINDKAVKFVKDEEAASYHATYTMNITAGQEYIITLTSSSKVAYKLSVETAQAVEEKAEEVTEEEVVEDTEEETTEEPAEETEEETVETTEEVEEEATEEEPAEETEEETVETTEEVEEEATEEEPAEEIEEETVETTEEVEEEATEEEPSEENEEETVETTEEVEEEAAEEEPAEETVEETVETSEEVEQEATEEEPAEETEEETVETSEEVEQEATEEEPAEETEEETVETTEEVEEEATEEEPVEETKEEVVEEPAEEKIEENASEEEGIEDSNDESNIDVETTEEEAVPAMVGWIVADADAYTIGETATLTATSESELDNQVTWQTKVGDSDWTNAGYGDTLTVVLTEENANNSYRFRMEDGNFSKEILLNVDLAQVKEAAGKMTEEDIVEEEQIDEEETVTEATEEAEAPAEAVLSDEDMLEMGYYKVMVILEVGSDVYSSADESSEIIRHIETGTELWVKPEAESLWASIYTDEEAAAEYVYLADMAATMKPENSEDLPIRKISIISSLDGVSVVSIHQEVILTVVLENFLEDDVYTCQWQYTPDQGETFITIEGADSLTYTYSIEKETIKYGRRMILTLLPKE